VLFKRHEAPRSSQTETLAVSTGPLVAAHERPEDVVQARHHHDVVHVNPPSGQVEVPQHT